MDWLLFARIYVVVFGAVIAVFRYAVLKYDYRNW